MVLNVLFDNTSGVVVLNVLYDNTSGVVVLNARTCEQIKYDVHDIIDT